jgi:hypothetical protein
MIDLNLARAIPAPWMLAGLAVLVVASAGFGYLKGIDHESDRHAQYRADIAAENARLEAEARRVKRESEQASRDAAAGWSAAVDYWRGHPRLVRVPGPAGSPACLRPVSAPSGRLAPDARQPGLGAGPDAPVAVSVAECESRLNAAVMDAAQVMWLLNWIEAQRGASEPSD